MWDVGQFSELVIDIGTGSEYARVHDRHSGLSPAMARH